jgi:hypothetical protein
VDVSRIGRKRGYDICRRSQREANRKKDWERMRNRIVWTSMEVAESR